MLNENILSGKKQNTKTTVSYDYFFQWTLDKRTSFLSFYLIFKTGEKKEKLGN